MIFVSDVHGAVEPLRRLVDTGEEIIILGDLVNLTDYRTGEGAVAQVLGLDFARESAKSRAEGDYQTMRSLWAAEMRDRRDEVRQAITEAIERQYEEVAGALKGGRGLVIHGNVDRPRQLMEILPEGWRYVHGEVVEVEGLRLGLVGGGIATPLRADGEVPDEEMIKLLDSLGEVDILCTHVPPAVPPLRRDVITGREERGSAPIRDYLRSRQPRFHFYGDVHQPQATTWRLGATRCVNAGYFRATGRFLRLRDAVVVPCHLG
ncbi:MAG: metallophosphoesterase [Acidimicrobiia bacterium]